MADTPTSSHQTGSRGTRGQRWMSERQLDAYLQARDALRRVRDAVTSADRRRGAASPPASAT